MLYAEIYNSVMESSLSRRDKLSLLDMINEKLYEIEDRSFLESVTQNKLDIYNEYAMGTITESQKDELLQLVEEKVIKRPMESLLKKLEDIRDSKPDVVYDKDVKSWVDANYDDIAKASDVIMKHKSRDDFTKADIAIMLAALAVLCTSPFLTLVPGALGAGLALGAIVISSIVYCVTIVIAGLRSRDYEEASDVLTSMKGYVSRIDTSKLSDEQKKKVKSISGRIDDVIEKNKTSLQKAQVDAINNIAVATATR